MSEVPKVILISADSTISDAVLSMAAAQGVTVGQVTQEPYNLGWDTALTVLVGVDLASKVVESAPPPHPKVVVVGFDPERVCSWSLPLGAAVAVLPDAARWLPGILREGGSRRAPLLAVLGGSGGIGCSSLAAGLAVTADRAGATVGLVDADPLSGGLDLLLGLEREPGWRWPKFRAATGTVGEVVPLLPRLNAIAVLSMARREPVLARGPILAVLESLRRSLDIVIVDVGRSPTAMAREIVRTASDSLILVGESVRSVAAAAEVVAAFDAKNAHLVVRGRNRLLAADIAQTLELPLLDCLPHDRRLAGAAERGEPPGIGRKAWAKTCQRVVSKWI